jgi:hypothetical protein
MNIRKYVVWQPLPFVKRVVFVSTPHRGSYAARGLVRRLARKFVSLPSQVVKRTSELAGVTEKLDLPKELRGSPTSLDGMSTKKSRHAGAGGHSAGSRDQGPLHHRG